VHSVDNFTVFYAPIFSKSGILNFLEPSGPLQVCIGIALLLHFALPGGVRFYRWFSFRRNLLNIHTQWKANIL